MTGTLTVADTDVIRARHEATTDGVWEQGGRWDGEFVPLADAGRVRIGLNDFAVVSGPEPRYADAAFIAHSHQDVPALLDTIDELRARPAQLREQISQYLRAQIFGDATPSDECDSEADYIVALLEGNAPSEGNAAAHV
jgi:hypothetical protein